MGLIHGLRVSPPLGHHQVRYMLEPLVLHVTCATPHNVEHVHTHVWTNCISQHDATGTWHALPMEKITPGPNGSIPQWARDVSVFHPPGTRPHFFRFSLMPTDKGQFELTVRARAEGEHVWTWAGGYGQNTLLEVRPPVDHDRWTTGPDSREVVPGVFLANYFASARPEEHGYGAVLNLARELDHVYDHVDDMNTVEARVVHDAHTVPGVRYKKISLEDGAHNVIPDIAISEGLAWMDRMRAEGRNVCVHCRAGIGRSGSMVVALVYRDNPVMTYEEACKTVWAVKPEVYPHRGLKDTCERLFPRATHVAG